MITNMNRIQVCRIVLLILLISIQTRLHSQILNNPNNQSWEEVKKSGKGSLTVFWNEAPPFIFKTSSGQLSGIEYELIVGFKNYVQSTYQVELEIIWNKQKVFTDIYEKILIKEEKAALGASGISITTERQKEVGFSPSYMADITVMISSENVPIARNTEEFMKLSPSLTAITVARSTFEQDLLKLKKAGDLPFKIEYVPNSNQILDEIQKRNNAFGLIDLAIYLNEIEKKPSAKVNRQNLFPKIRKGFGLIYPLGSDWAEPLTRYFQEEHFRENLQQIVSHYINLDNYNFIESLTDNSESQITLLTREKEIQLAHLKEEIRTRNLGIALLAIVITSLFFIILLFRKSHQLIKEIEEQRKSIEIRNKELELKNKKLEEFTFANVHKLRSPVSEVLGLIQLFDFSEPTDNDRIVALLKQSSFNLDKEIKDIRIKLEEEGLLTKTNPS